MPMMCHYSPRALLSALCLIYGLALGGASSCGPGTEEEPRIYSGVSTRGLFEVELSTSPDPIPLNQPFELDVIITSEGSPPSDEVSWTLRVEGWMPGHGHGMLRQPQVDELGEGRYRVRGMLFHMPGLWELRVLVIETRIEEDYRIVEDDKVSIEVTL
jgi:hypothetical protein